MLDTIKDWEYKAKAGVPGAKEYLETRLSDRMELPLLGIHGEKLYLTGVQELTEKTRMLDFLYEDTPIHRGAKDVILLDAWSSATIEGARTTVAQVKKSAVNPVTKDDKMVLNTIKGSNYGFTHSISEKNIRCLWEMVVADVCENSDHRGELYRDGMVYIGDTSRTVHTPAKPEQLPELMNSLFAYGREEHADVLIASFAIHFYFVYIHPFCDGNGRTARIVNASMLYHGGYEKMKNLPLCSAINAQLSGYYKSISDSENVIHKGGEVWLDLSPFVSYMLDAFERCLIDAALSKNELTEKETKLLERMNKVGPNAEITTTKANQILKVSESTVRRVLMGLVQKGYLSVNTEHAPYIYRLQQHMPDV